MMTSARWPNGASDLAGALTMNPERILRCLDRNPRRPTR